MLQVRVLQLRLLSATPPTPLRRVSKTSSPDGRRKETTFWRVVGGSRLDSSRRSPAGNGGCQKVVCFPRIFCRIEARHLLVVHLLFRFGGFVTLFHYSILVTRAWHQRGSKGCLCKSYLFKFWPLNYCCVHSLASLSFEFSFLCYWFLSFIPRARNSAPRHSLTTLLHYWDWWCSRCTRFVRSDFL